MSGKIGVFLMSLCLPFCFRVTVVLGTQTLSAGPGQWWDAPVV